jgi:F0F1-type ATP synthase assembly protein I
VQDSGKSPWRYAHIGIQLAVSTLLGFGAGFWLDKKMNTGPWLALLGAGLFFAAGLYSVIAQLMDDK